MTRRPHLVLSIPEILHDVLSRLSRSDLIPLTRVSRAFFQAAIVHIWTQVEAENLLSLLPDSTASAVLEPMIDSQANPSTLLDDYFTRFHLYGSHVKKSDYTINSDEITRILRLSNLSIWKSILCYASTCQLLPSLRSFTVRVSYGSRLVEIFDWVLCLAPSSLVQVRLSTRTVHGRRLGLDDPDVALELIEALLNKCPHIEDLMILDNDDVANSDLQTYPHFSRFVPLSELRILRLDPVFLGVSLLNWLDKLPRLERLEISSLNLYHCSVLQRVPAPATSLGALQTVRVGHLPYPASGSALWKAVGFRSLTNVELEFAQGYLAPTESDFFSFATTLASDSPHISTLSLSSHSWNFSTLLLEWLEFLKPLLLSSFHLNVLPMRVFEISEALSGASVLRCSFHDHEMIDMDWLAKSLARLRRGIQCFSPPDDPEYERTPRVFYERLNEAIRSFSVDE